jgi:ribosome-associated protein
MNELLDPILRQILEKSEWQFVRSSGPGGQNVNKVNSKAQLYWPVLSSMALPPDMQARFLARYGHKLTKDGVLILQSDRYRDQQKNKADCIEKLITILEGVLFAPKARKKTKPSRAAREQRKKSKRKHSEKKKSRSQKNWH